MLGLYAIAVLRERGFDTVYCSGVRGYRSKFIEHFGGIPLYNGKQIDLLIFKRFSKNKTKAA